ncbi:MAG TPA: glycerol-3-phosphate 1-O-acyltransferase PlsY [Hyphomicrobiaceae bacterium]|nr:glycerol-3-phosphate 1-O-acyltransferase PlsY [Hyphomicrobiaceae bacterium]
MSTVFTLPVLLALLAGYLLGSIPFGLILTRAAGLGDIRRLGSGNIGATNVLRTGHRGLAAATLALDALKGTAAVLLAKSGALGLLPGPIVPLAAGLGALLGHLFPVWLGFRGGKGVATYIGVLAALYPLAALAFVAVWLAVAAATRYSSLSALSAAIATPFAVWALGRADAAVLLAPTSALLVFAHRANIRRLIAGVEPKIGAKA